MSDTAELFEAARRCMIVESAPERDILSEPYITPSEQREFIKVFGHPIGAGHGEMILMEMKAKALRLLPRQQNRRSNRRWLNG